MPFIRYMLTVYKKKTRVFRVLSLVLSLFLSLSITIQEKEEIFSHLSREGAKFIETGAGHSGTGAVTFFNTVNRVALTFFTGINFFVTRKSQGKK